MHESDQEIICPVVVSNHPWHFEAVKGPPVDSVVTSATDPHALFYCGIKGDVCMLGLVFSLSEPCHFCFSGAGLISLKRYF